MLSTGFSQKSFLVPNSVQQEFGSKATNKQKKMSIKICATSSSNYINCKSAKAKRKKNIGILLAYVSRYTRWIIFVFLSLKYAGKYIKCFEGL